MTWRTEPPFRADHVGSLLRPAPLREARADYADGRLAADELQAVEDAAVRQAIHLQEEIGLQCATDGEFRRGSWHMDFIYQLGGITKTDQKIQVKMRNAAGAVPWTVNSTSTPSGGTPKYRRIFPPAP